MAQQSYRNGNGNGDRDFTVKVWKATAIVALVVVLLWILKVSFNVLLLILAGVLIAVFFRGLADLIHRRLHVPQKGSLAISITGTLALVVLFFLFAGSRIGQQAEELSRTLPSGIESLKQQVSKSPMGQKALERASSPESQKRLMAVARTFFHSSFGALGDIYVVLFLGIFFTVAPGVYVKGMLRLVPPGGRPRAEDVADKLGLTLKKWLKGQLFAMLVVAVLTAIGLLVMGVPIAFTLALIAGLLNFIPNFGPLIAMVPAILVALVLGPDKALMVAGLYIAVQVVESNFITPQIQKKMIHLPPALIIIAQLFMGVLTGGWGLVLATPLTALLLVLVQELYVKRLEEGPPEKSSTTKFTGA